MYGDGGYSHAKSGQSGARRGFVSQLLFQCTGLYAVSRDAHFGTIRVADRYVAQWAVYSRGTRTLAGALNDAGYRTGWVGKWHLGATGNVWIPPELRADFTEFIGYQCYNDFFAQCEILR